MCIRDRTIGDNIKNIDISDVYKTNNILYLVTTLSYLVAVVLNLIGGF